MARFDITQYLTVAERIDIFWERYPQGRLHTELIHFTPEQVVIRAEVYLDREDPVPVTMDYAEERPETSPVNRVSMVENCATSALGRALGDLGSNFTGAKRPSAEEMLKVQRHESQAKRDWVGEAAKMKDKDALRLLWAEASQSGASPEQLAKVKEYAEGLDSNSVDQGADSGVSRGTRAKKS